ncbi:MAG: hypothetical protein ACYSW8_21875, partial [Planctomycetota bacterium]
MRDTFCPNRKLTFIALLCLVFSPLCPAVNSKVVRHTSSSDLLKGKIEKVVIGSRGTIQLGRAAEPMVDQFENFDDVWSINSIVTHNGVIYFGTSPNGGIYKYHRSKLLKIYPDEKNEDKSEPEDEPQEQLSEIEQLVQEIIEAEEYLTNEHIFAMAIDDSGRLLAGISGKECKLCRFTEDKMEVIFEPDDARYIFAI